MTDPMAASDAPDDTKRIDDRSLTREERSRRTNQLLRQARVTRDSRRREELLDEVVLLNLCVAEAVANRYRGRGVAVEDLHQTALEGLVKAVRRFDPSVRPDLLTYAVPTIRGEVQRMFRDQGWMVRPPRRVQELQWKIGRSMEQLSTELGREPSGAEVSDDVGCPVEEVDEALSAFGCFRPPSLDTPVHSGTGSTLGDLLMTEDDQWPAAEARVALAPVLRSLPERDRRILFLRFFEDQTQREIGDELGVTQMQVSRLLRQILSRLRAQIA